MAGVCTLGNIGQSCLIDAICRPALEDKAPVAIAALDIAVLIDLEIDSRMAKCGGPIVPAATNVARTVTAHAAGFDMDYFGRGNVHVMSR